MSICYNCFKEFEGEICPHCGYDPTSENNKNFHALKSGTILNGKYVLGRVIGQGGFGITYIAQNYETKELLAIKEYYPEDYCSRESGNTVSAFSSSEAADNFIFGKERFLDEAKTLSQFIGNENIVRIYSYFEENGTAYLVMEFVSGDGLDKYVAAHGGKLSVDEANALLMPIADALEYVHSKGVVHRDIAPDNIIITKDGTAKLIDFGAARYSTGEKTKSLDVILKHGFAPLEQYSRHGRQGPFTDLYAFAATYYYAITGRVPVDSIDRLNNDFLIVPSSLGVKISDVQETALLKALAVQYTDRFTTVEDFKNAFTGKVKIETATFERTREEKIISEKPNKDRKASKKLFFIIPLIAAIVIGAIFLIPKQQKTDPAEIDYNRALELIDEARYSEAIDVLNTIKEYENSEELLEESEYNLAISYEEAGDLDNALGLFESLGDFNDSRERVNELSYSLAKQAYESNDFSRAIELLDSIGEYEDSAQINELAEYYLAIADANVGDIVNFGSYEQDNNFTNGNEDIEWIVAAKEGDKLLLISKYGLDAQAYHTTYWTVTWEESTIREWLNNYFLNSAFTEEQQSKISITDVVMTDNTHFSKVISGGENTNDKIFLLSEDEAKKYFLDDNARILKPTDYAIAQGANIYSSTNKVSWWWLRSLGSHSNAAEQVLTDGSISFRGNNVNNNYGAIRPAIWIDFGS